MLKSLEYWENQSNLRKFTLSAYKEILIGTENPKKVLDWGCGDGLMAMSLFPEAEITGLELDQALIFEACRNAEHNGKNFKIGSIEEIKRANCDFDAVIMLGLFEYLTDEKLNNILSQAYSFLKPGGTLFSTFYYWRPYSAIYLPYLVRAKMSYDLAYADYSSAAGFAPSKRTMDNTINLLQENEFRLIELGGVNPYPSWFWKFIKSESNFITKNKMLSIWY